MKFSFKILGNSSFEPNMVFLQTNIHSFIVHMFYVIFMQICERRIISRCMSGQEHIAIVPGLVNSATSVLGGVFARFSPFVQNAR